MKDELLAWLEENAPARIVELYNNRNECWYEQANSLRQQLAEKDAQLARCVEGLKTERSYCHAQSEHYNQISKLLNSLPDSAKHDVEILRCAEWAEKDHRKYTSNTDGCQCKLCKAVRASEGFRKTSEEV